MQVKFTENIIEFLDDLDDETLAKIQRRIDLLREYGHMLRMPYSKPIGNSVFELRVEDRGNTRLVYVFMGGVAVIFHAFIKKTDRISKKDMNTIFIRLKGLQL
ncbi:MAG: type II toxin-antitoxin system RelE/ParE family toxin [Patescibacteria group bacterium]|nr:type II toxin-antitoxin system RelE/ParE family toxin [Patescibacteria group bacterium]